MKRYIPFGIALGAVIVLQLVFSLAHAEYYLTQLIMSAYYTLVVIGLCLLMGYAGQISLGHAAFFAIGGYVSAVLTTVNLLPMKDNGFISLLISCGLTVSGRNPYGVEIAYVNPWIAMCIAALASALIALIIGIPVLRLKGHYLAMATLGFGTIIQCILLGADIFGAADGISDVPAFAMFPGVSVCGAMAHRIVNYYIAWGLVIMCALIIRNLIHSRAGRALRSIHGNEEAAQAMGVNVARYKVALFVFSAVVAAVAGIFLTHYNGGIGPSEAGLTKSVRYVSIVAVGGMANLWGALVASVVLNFLSLRGYFGSYDNAVFGIILVVMMLYAPEGILRKPRKDA
jgi:branched-chain amino acid transport system permease protein